MKTTHRIITVCFTGVQYLSSGGKGSYEKKHSSSQKSQIYHSALENKCYYLTQLMTTRYWEHCYRVSQYLANSVAMTCQKFVKVTKP